MTNNNKKNRDPKLKPQEGLMINDTLIRIFGNEPSISHIVLAYELGVDARSISKLIDKLKPTLKELGKVRFEITPSNSGQNQKQWMLNEEQAFFTINCAKNSVKSVALKAQLTREFMLYRDIATQRSTGKTIRQHTTDAIKSLVDYAKGQGSENADRYYTILTRMVYQTLFGIKDVPRAFRDSLPPSDLCRLGMAEDMLSTAIYAGIGDNIAYKDIYRQCKGQIKALAELVAC